MESKGCVFNIQKFSTNDGPGIRTTVFLKGCPLHCGWCSNPESQAQKPQILWDLSKCVRCQQCVQTCPQHAVQFDVESGSIRFDFKTCVGCGACVAQCPQEALTLEGEWKDVEDVVAVCLQDRVFYEGSGGGVTLSGGEPMMQPNFAAALLSRLKQEGIATAIETTGYAPSAVFNRLLPDIDLFLFDCKHYDRQKHYEATGVYNDPILQNLKTALQSGKEVIVRIPVIPGVNNQLDDAQGFCELFQTLGVKRINLLPFHQFGERKYDFLNRVYSLHGIPALHEADLEAFRAVFFKNGFDCFF